MQNFTDIVIKVGEADTVDAEQSMESVRGCIALKTKGYNTPAGQQYRDITIPESRQY